jgi:hypothetical protein
MALCLIRALSWQLVDHGPSGQNLTPRGEHLLVAVCMAIPLFPAGALLWSAITRRLRTRLAVTLVLMLVLGAASGFATLIAWSKLFDGHYTTSVISPDGAREAHLHVDGLLGCSGTIYVSEPGGVFGSFVTERSVSCKDIGVRWQEDGGVEVTGSAPEPLNLFFGPH